MAPWFFFSNQKNFSELIFYASANSESFGEMQKNE